MALSRTQHERFTTLMEAVYTDLERFVRALVRRAHEDQEIARDVLAETIACAFEGFHTLRNEQAFLSFLLTIATRVHREHRKRSAGLVRYDDDNAMEQMIAQHQPAVQYYAPQNDTDYDVALLYIALDKLPEKQREALIMFELLCYSMKEIAAMQGDALVAVKVRVSRARTALQRLLNEPSLP
jgi:RNA polymerase sigma-70 factor (ECF subfamily)